jgi:hypothetical protein
MTRILFLSAIALAILPAPTAKAEPLVLCGWDEVFLVDLPDVAKGKIEKLWQWRATDRKELPEAVRGSFRTTDDCKPVDGGAKILISSSSGGCALVERPSGRVLWHAVVPNAHSLERLPRGRVIAASSADAKGNRLVLFDLSRPDRPVWETPLPSAHGVLWDEKRQCLWALGLAELRCYEPKDWASQKPSLTVKASYPLPDEGGHDLQAVPQSSDLAVTTGRHVYLFDREQRRFRLHPELGGKANVKCVSVHPVSGRTAFVQGGSKAWWSDTIGLLSPAGEVRLPGERLYKVRWMVRPPDGKPRQPRAPCSATYGALRPIFRAFSIMAGRADSIMSRTSS